MNDKADSINIKEPSGEAAVPALSEAEMGEKSALPLTEEGVRDFLAGEFVEGIGPAFASKLVDRYGVDALEILRTAPSSIEGIPGLGAGRIETASQSLNGLKVAPEFLAGLYSCGVPDLFVGRIVGKYGKRSPEMVVRDPYSMVEDVWRLSFFTADKIGKALGFADTDPRRLSGALLTAVKHYAENGHLYASPEQAVEYAAEISDTDPENVRKAIPLLEADGRLVLSRGGLYLPVFYEAERDVARKMAALAAAPPEQVADREIPQTDLQGHIYSPRQRLAIRTALEEPVTVITGGPGSGKTTVLKGVIDILHRKGKKFILAAPTGRAAKRMSVLTGFEARTIHRLLGYRQGEGYHNRKIDADVLIIDEGSMIEQVLLNHLLQAVGTATKIIIVGDTDQLPAIGAGDVMRELIKSGTVAVVELDENFRQSRGGGIASGAQAINRGEVPATDDGAELLMVRTEGVKGIRDRILQLVGEELPEKFGISPDEILVVTPQQMGPLGARQLNIDLQACLNPSGPEIKRATSVMRLGDPVMQTANSRERDLYNGEVGRIVEVDSEARWLIVEYPGGRRSRYSRSELSELVLAYATTVHKLQGSEVEYMVIPITMAHRPMLYRNLLYTGVSRARQLCVLVGEEEALQYAVENIGETRRNSNFSSRLRAERAGLESGRGSEDSAGGVDVVGDGARE